MQPRFKFRSSLNSPLKPIICVVGERLRGRGPASRLEGASEPELLFINLLFLAVLGPCCFMGAFSSGSKQGYSLAAGHGLLIAAASLVEHRLQL